MFKEMGAMMGMLKNLPKLQEQMEQLQARVAAITAEGSAGGGLVTARVSGRMEVLSVTIAPEAAGDPELLGDLVAAAVNAALAKARDEVAAASGILAGGMPGFPSIG